MGLVNRLRGPPPVVLTQGAWGGGLRVCISNQLHFENHCTELISARLLRMPPKAVLGLAPFPPDVTSNGL